MDPRLLVSLGLLTNLFWLSVSCPRTKHMVTFSPVLQILMSLLSIWLLIWREVFSVRFLCLLMDWIQSFRRNSFSSRDQVVQDRLDLLKFLGELFRCRLVMFFLWCGRLDSFGQVR